jgi:hypothetical protein
MLSRLSSSLFIFRANKNIPLSTSPNRRTNDPQLLQLIDQSSCARISDPQTPLKQGCTGTLCLPNDSNSLFDQIIYLR